eukprot:g39193.t1
MSSSSFQKIDDKYSNRNLSLDKWIKQHDKGVPPRPEQTQDDLDQILAKQAKEHGMKAYDPAAEDVHFQASLKQWEADEQARLDTFSGVRKAASKATEVECYSGDGGEGEASAFERVDFDHLSSVKDLTRLGLDVLKQELTLLGLKCGGTLEERAERLWLVKVAKGDLNQLDPKHFAKKTTHKPKKKKHKKGQGEDEEEEEAEAQEWNCARSFNARPDKAAWSEAPQRPGGPDCVANQAKQASGATQTRPAPQIRQLGPDFIAEKRPEYETAKQNRPLGPLRPHQIRRNWARFETRETAS